MSLSTEDEAALVELASTGNAEAFGELYKLHLEAIYRYIYHRVNNPSDAQDLTQQVYLQAWKALPGYEDRGKRFSSWLYRIAHNIVVSFYHQKKRTIPISLLGLEDWESDQACLLNEVMDVEEVVALNSAVAQLPDEQQQVINLRFVEGLNHAQVAEILEKSAGASRMLQYRALSTLSEVWMS